MPTVPVWSLSHWYMWIPLWLLICAFSAMAIFIIGKIIIDGRRERRDRKLLKYGIITVNEYRQRKRARA